MFPPQVVSQRKKAGQDQPPTRSQPYTGTRDEDSPEKGYCNHSGELHASAEHDSYGAAPYAELRQRRNLRKQRKKIIIAFVVDVIVVVGSAHTHLLTYFLFKQMVESRNVLAV